MSGTKRFYLSLRLRFVILSVLILIAVFSGLTVVLIHNNNKEMRKTLLDQSKAFAALATRPAGETFLLYKDSGRLLIDKQVKELQALNKDITNITIVDIYGRNEYSFDAANAPTVSAEQASTFETQYVYNNGLVNKVISPYFENNKSHRYTVVFSVSSASIEKAIANETRALAVAGTVALIVTSLATFVFINRYILKPVSAVSDQAEIISKGDLNQQIVTNREDEIGRLAESVNHMAQSLKTNIAELKELDKVKSEFMMITSHNLRTPLTIINGYLEVINEQTKPEEVMKAFQNVSSSAKRLSMFAEDILNISKMELGDNSTHKEPIFIEKLLRQISTDYESIAQTKGIVFTSHIPPLPGPIESDKAMLRLSILNLLDNAIKFTPKGGQVDLKLHHDGQKAYISVADNGIGISPDEQKKLFTKFHRGTSTLTYDYEGVGIGLYTSKQMLRLLGGDITFKSELGKGSTFMIEMPMTPLAPAQSAILRST